MEEKALILSIDFQTDEAMRRSAALRESIDADKAALQELNKTIKESGQATAEQALQREKLEHSIRENTRARSDENRSIDAYVKASKASFDATGKYSGSIKDMRAALSFLTNQWNELSREQRENAEEGGKLQAHIKSLSDELKELEGSVGDNRRSVGGYLDAIKQAPGFMGKMRAGMQGLNGVMAANPVGALVQAFQLFLPLLQSSGEGADFFGKAMGMVNAIVQEGLKRLVALGGAAVKLFTGDFKGAFEDGSKAIANFGESVIKAAQAGGKLADDLDALEEKERAFGLASAETEKEIDKLIKQATSRGKSEAERQKLYEQAEKLELRRNKQAIALAQQRIDLVKEQNKQSQEDSDIQDERLKTAQTNLVNLQRESQNILEKIQVRKDNLDVAAQAKEKARKEKAAEDEKKRQEKAAEDALAALDKINEAEKQQAQDIADLRELDQKAAADDLQFKFDVSRADQKRKDDDAAADRKRIEDNIALKKAEYEVISGLAEAGKAVLRAIATENEDFAVFQKALTGFQIAMDLAQAVSKLTASSTEVAAAVAAVSGPAGVITGPLAYASYYGTQILAIGNSIAQARQLLKVEPPKAQHYDGFGYTGDGNPTAESTAVGPKPYTYHKKELIASNAALSTPLGAAAGNVLMEIMGKEKRFNIPGYFNGGMAPVSSFAPAGGSFMTQNAATGIDYNELAKAMASQPIYVRPTEIVSQANKTNARKASTTIG